MTDATVAPNVFETLDVTTHNTLQLTFDGEVLVDVLLNTANFCVRKVFDPYGSLDFGGCQDIIGCFGSDAMNICQGDSDLFFSGDGYPRDSCCHELSLPLLMLWFKLIYNV